eukprot:scaffold94163_cov64-Cyclotella_meneghiniana.AAC.1
MGRLKINSPNRSRISSTPFRVNVSGVKSIYSVGRTIFVIVITKCGALVGSFAGSQISITGICSDKLKDMKFSVGEADGEADGDELGLKLGDFVGLAVGEGALGDADGDAEGDALGLALGLAL